jgi:hypothetical protein
VLVENRRQDEQLDYLDDLWDLLHHCDDEARLMMGLKTYLDDAGGDDKSPLVTCGGVVMSRLDFKEFSKRWGRMYDRNQFSGYALEPPLHMCDFVGYGKYTTLYPEFKRHLFLDVAKLINEHKLYSISVAVSQTDFNEVLSPDVRGNLIGPYALAFFSIVLAHQIVSERSGPIRTSYLVDAGFGHHDQLVQAHKVIVRFEQALRTFRHTGALATDTDDRVPTLQAADAISWASRRIVLDGALPEGFEPLTAVLRADIKPPHQTIRIRREGLKMFAEPINNWIAKKGKMPELTDILSREFRGVQVKLRKDE